MKRILVYLFQMILQKEEKFPAISFLLMIVEKFVLGKIAPDALPNFGKNIILKYKGDTDSLLWANSYTLKKNLNEKESKAKGLC